MSPSVSLEEKPFSQEQYKNEHAALVTANQWLQQVRGAEGNLTDYQQLFTAEIASGEPVNATCTDERPIVTESVCQPDREHPFIRLPGGAAGLIHAIEDASDLQSPSRSAIVEAAQEAGLALYNHRDNVHGTEAHKVGCGYLGLLKMEQAEAVFGRRIDDVHAYVTAMETDLDIPTVTLSGEHVAQDGGFFINVDASRALNPEGPAQNAFFSLDLGIIAQRLQGISEQLGLSREQSQQILTNLARDNMAAVYVLSNGAIDNTRFGIVGQPDEYMETILETAYAEFTEPQRVAAMNEMITARR